jgi:hypothetical protein
MLSRGVAEAAKLDGKSTDDYGLDAGKAGLLARVSITKPGAAPTP